MPSSNEVEWQPICTRMSKGGLIRRSSPSPPSPPSPYIRSHIIIILFGIRETDLHRKMDCRSLWQHPHARSHNDCSVIYRYPTLTYSHVTNYLSNYLSIYCLTLLSIYLSIKSVNREESRTAPLFFLEPTLAQTFLHLGLLSNASSR